MRGPRAGCPSRTILAEDLRRKPLRIIAVSRQVARGQPAPFRQPWLATPISPRRWPVTSWVVVGASKEKKQQKTIPEQFPRKTYAEDRSETAAFVCGGVPTNYAEDQGRQLMLKACARQ